MKPLSLLLFFIFGWLLPLPLALAETDEKELLTPAQIDELLAPIALYPDPLIAIILPASTFSTDIVLAARHLEAGNAPDTIDAQPWDDSVKSLARYPEVVRWMDENLDWTRQLGTAFLLQPAAVLNGTQRLRAAAVAAGNLKDTPEQTVVVEREVIRIVPARREVIYVPVYDPVLIYRPHPVHSVVYHSRPLLSFSIGYPAGFWLSYHCNWTSRTVVVINPAVRRTVWHRYPSWTYPSHTVVHHHHHHTWRPNPTRVHTVRRDFERHRHVPPARPTANPFVRDRQAARVTSPAASKSPQRQRLAQEKTPERVSPPNRAEARVRTRNAPPRVETPATKPTRAPAITRTNERPQSVLRTPSAERPRMPRAERNEARQQSRTVTTPTNDAPRVRTTPQARVAPPVSDRPASRPADNTRTLRQRERATPAPRTSAVRVETPTPRTSREITPPAAEQPAPRFQRTDRSSGSSRSGTFNHRNRDSR